MARRTHSRPRPGRRRSHLTSLVTFQILTFSVLFLSILCVPALASDGRGSRARRSPVGQIGDIIFDPRPVPEAPLFRRQLLDVSSSTSSAQASSTADSAGSTSAAGSTAAGSIATPTPSSTPTTTSSSSSQAASSLESAPTDSSLPKPFDAGLGTNYTQPSCPNFLNSMINNSTFTSCLPFSLLLQNSNSFFQASRSLQSVTITLDASCNIVFPACSALISSFALALRGTSACAQDYERQNPFVRQAYNGLVSYDILYHAACLHATPSPANNNTNNYCFANAVTNTTSPTDSYVYYLPLGIQLPGGSEPSCNQCLKDTMGVFQGQAANKSQPLSQTYFSSAQMVDQLCGPNFVNQTALSGARATSGAAAVDRGVSWLRALVPLVGLVQVFAML